MIGPAVVVLTRASSPERIVGLLVLEDGEEPELSGLRWSYGVTLASVAGAAEGVCVRPERACDPDVEVARVLLGAALQLADGAPLARMAAGLDLVVPWDPVAPEISAQYSEGAGVTSSAAPAPSPRRATPRRGAPSVRRCAVCGVLLPTGSWRVTCSDRCRTARRRARARGGAR